VVSYGASLYRQEGEPPQRPVHLFQLGFASPAARLSRQDRFALEDLIRVRPEKPSPDLAALIDRHSSEHAGFQDLYVRARDEGGLRQTAWPAEIVPLCDYQAVRPLDGATVAADIICGDGRAVLPGVVLSRHGKGRVAYVAAAMESLYLRTNLRELADAIQSLILWAAPQPPPYTIDGPDCLIANLTTGDDACVLHLVNWTGSKLEQAGVNEYGLAPVENVRLRLRKPPGRKIAQVALLVDASLQQKDLDDSLEILLPRVEAYQGIRFRWA